MQWCNGKLKPRLRKWTGMYYCQSIPDVLIRMTVASILKFVIKHSKFVPFLMTSLSTVNSSVDDM